MNEWSDDEIRRMGGMVEVHWRANGEVEEILHEGNVQNVREAIERDLRGERYRASPTEPTRFQRVLATDLLYTSPEAEPNSSQIRLNKGTVVFGTDDRSYVNHTTNQGWPYSTAIAFRLPNGGASGSGTLVGAHTIITAAHLFYDIPSSSWNASPLSWVAGLVHTNCPGCGGHISTSKYPAGGVFKTSAYPNATGYVPSCYYNLHATGCDIAFVDLLTDSPGVSGNFIPLGIGSTNDYYAGITQMAAYDYNNPPPGPLNPPFFVVQSEVYRYYGIGNLWSDGAFLHTWMDITQGASGGGIINQIFKNVGDPTHYYAGNYFGGTTQDYPNVGLTFTNYWLQELKDHTTEFN